MTTPHDGPNGTGRPGGTHAARGGRRGLRLVALPLALALVVAPGLAACSDSGGSDEVASLGDRGAGTTAPTATGSGAEEELLRYVECLRGQGVDVPDPSVDADGDISFDLGGGAGAGLDLTKIRKARDTCGAPPAGLLSRLDPSLRVELEDTMLAFTRCLREHGVDVGDLDLSAGATPGEGSRLPGLDRNDPAVQDAVEACQKVFTGVTLDGSAD